mmetsp:Transcript_12987/g.34151  ORF Transcript_12987/g.34151 Transcript_12987/m.34151 type:complete len:80 (-) Transcript_12987:67-306(-)
MPDAAYPAQRKEREGAEACLLQITTFFFFSLSHLTSLLRLRIYHTCRVPPLHSTASNRQQGEKQAESPEEGRRSSNSVR